MRSSSATTMSSWWGSPWTPFAGKTRVTDLSHLFPFWSFMNLTDRCCGLNRLARHMGPESVARELVDEALANGEGWMNKESLCRGMGQGFWRDEELAWADAAPGSSPA